VLLRARLPRLRGLGQVVSRCRQLLDLDTDPEPVGAVLAADELLAPLVAARPGVRVPGCCDGFELAVRAVLGQQVSLAAARTMAGRLAARFGTALDPPPGEGGPAVGDAAPASRSYGTADGGAPGCAPAGPGAPALLFPEPAALADADLSGLGMTTARQATVRSLAAAAASGRLALDRGADPQETAARLAELPGIGPWTSAYILMRALGDPDAFPATDLGLRRALGRLGGSAARARRWRPWRAYAAMHLWAAEAARPAVGPAAGTQGHDDAIRSGK
jgi:AraC family transcriptional regulator of adaptative response / DNA-3-methyladenine glycosylase II